MSYSSPAVRAYARRQIPAIVAASASAYLVVALWRARGWEGGYPVAFGTALLVGALVSESLNTSSVEPWGRRLPRILTSVILTVVVLIGLLHWLG